MQLTCGEWGSFRWRVRSRHNLGWDKWAPLSWRPSSWRVYHSGDPPSVCGPPADSRRRYGVWRTSHWCDPGCRSPAPGICREQRKEGKRAEDKRRVVQQEREKKKERWSQAAGEEIKRVRRQRVRRGESKNINCRESWEYYNKDLSYKLSLLGQIHFLTSVFDILFM